MSKLPQTTKKKTLMDIIHKKTENALVVTDRGDGVEVDQNIIETTEYFEDKLNQLINPETGHLHLEHIFTQIGANLATKSVASDILLNKVYSIVMKRLMTEPGMISDKDLFGLLKIASNEGSNATNDLKKMLDALTDVKQIEQVERQKKMKRDMAVSGIREEDMGKLASVIADINMQLEVKARTKKEDDDE